MSDSMHPELNQAMFTAGTRHKAFNGSFLELIYLPMSGGDVGLAAFTTDGFFIALSICSWSERPCVLW
ncbi:unnamed protein product, partial [Musa textilis]